MSRIIEVLLLDDGELDDVQGMLQEMHVNYGRVRGNAIVEGSPPPKRLLVTTPKRMHSVRLPKPVPGGERPPSRIVVVGGDQTPPNSELLAVGLDYLVRRPVHPEALRLLLLHCVYSGRERRRQPRQAVGIEIGVRWGLRRRQATLVDLSLAGCRLIANWRPELRKRLTLSIPRLPPSQGDLSLRASVLRSVRESSIDGVDLYGVALTFEDLDVAATGQLEALLAARALGPARVDEGGLDSVDASLPQPLRPVHDLARRPQPEAPPERVPLRPRPAGTTAAVPTPNQIDTTAAPDRPAAAAASPGLRQRVPRGLYARKVPAFGDRAMRVLVARDLSRGGMRIEPQADLGLGDRLHLAIYGDAGQEPLLTWARVSRDDGPLGLALLFENVTPEGLATLDQIVAGLPRIERYERGAGGSSRAVISEILER